MTTCIDAAVAQLDAKGIPVSAVKALGITNQRETTILWDRDTGKALHNAIVWTDTRTASIVCKFKARPGNERLISLCGEELTTYPSVTKVLWLLEHVDAVRECFEKGELMFGTVDSWLVYRLNGGTKKNIHVTDSTNASRTMFMDIHKLEYSADAMRFFSPDYDLNKIRLPKIVKSADDKVYGRVDGTALDGVPITGCLGDQSAALVGHQGFDAGCAKNTYGESAIL